MPLLTIVHEAEAPSELGLSPKMKTFMQVGRSASEAFQNRATPQAFAVDSSGTVLDVLIPGSVEDLQSLARKCKVAASETKPKVAAAQI